MHLATLILVSALSSSAQTPAAERLPVAVLQSGERVPCTTAAAGGERSFATPFGRFEALGDPIVELADAAAEARLLRQVRASDFTAWAARASARGLVQELVSAAGDPELSPEQRAAALGELEKWGARFNPAPAKADKEQRVAWLWEEIGEADPARGALLAGRLAAEISGASAPFAERISLTTLRRALRGGNPVVQRAAALVARKQEEMDLRLPLVEASLALKEIGDPGVRQACAAAAQYLDPDQSLTRWALALFRAGKDEVRAQAAEYLGHYGNAESVHALVYALSSSGRAPGSTTFFGRQISYVSDFDVEVAQGAIIADPIVSVVTEGTALEVRIISTFVSRAVMNSLQRLTGTNPGAREEDWLRWYRDTRIAAG